MRRGYGRLGVQQEEGVDPGDIPSSPGLLVSAQTAHGAVPGATADAGIRRGEAAYSTEGALGPGWGSCASCQVVGALGHTQVLQIQGGRLHSFSAHPHSKHLPGTSISLGTALPCGLLPASAFLTCSSSKAWKFFRKRSLK